MWHFNCKVPILQHSISVCLGTGRPYDHLIWYYHTPFFSETSKVKNPSLCAMGSIYCGSTHSLSSASSSFMEEKLALPTPTMITDMGSRDALMIANLVSAMSLNAPSVSSSRTKYCFRQKWKLANRPFSHKHLWAASDSSMVCGGFS